MPAVFGDAALAPHHKLIGRWVAAREDAPQLYTRQEARQHVERLFGDAVAAIFKPVDIVKLRVVALTGEGDLPPALAIICDDIGQIGIGWIEKSNVLSTTLFETVAPVGWRAAAYRALAQALPAVLPVLGYDDLIDELSGYWWEGAYTDDDARASLIEMHGTDEDDGLADDMLPSSVHARRPDWMTAKAAPLKHMPRHIREALTRLRDAEKAVRAVDRPSSAWLGNREHVDEYMPELGDRSHLPPLTIVPFDHFARELDDVCRFGMELGFDDVISLYPLADTDAIDSWLASLRLGVEVLAAAQALIALDPAAAR